MIKKVTLKNFQAHKNLEVELGKFTTLTGGSNGGKSAVLRAILALSKNDSANDYLRHGQKTLTVTLEFEDGHEVTWTKGSGENNYVINYPDGTSQEFDKVGSNVPEEVQKVLKFGPLAVGKDKHYVNFHRQLEAPFLISATAGDVAKLFGELTSASQLYSAVNEGNRSVRSTNAQKKTRMGDLRQVKVDLEDFSDVDEIECSLSNVHDQLIKAKKYEAKISELEAIATSVAEAQETIDVLRMAESKAQVANSVSLDDLVVAGSRAADLERTVTGIEVLNERLEKGLRGEKLLRTAVESDLATLEDVSKHISGLIHTLSGVDTVDGRIEDVRTSLEALMVQMGRDRDRYDELIEQVDACPWCESALSSATKDALLSKVLSSAAN